MGDFKGGFVEAEKALLFPTKRHEHGCLWPGLPIKQDSFMSKSAIFSVKLFIPALLKSPAKSITALGVQIKNAVHFLFFTPLNLHHVRVARAWC